MSTRCGSMERCNANAWSLIAATALTCAVCANAAADPVQPAPSGTAPDSQLEEIVVFGRAERLIGTAETASEGTVGGADLSVRPLSRVAELLEVVPGLIAAQHSGSGKANQYFLRGFNLDHGTDFTTYVDGVPMNLRSHGHGQGYLDVNGLIPETVDSIDYRKGTYRADVGDFSMAGASFVRTVDRVHPFLSVESGDYGWRRLVAGGSANMGGGTLTAIAQLREYDGPWQLAENLEHQSIWAKYATEMPFGALEATVSGYHAQWHPTEQIPERAIGTAVCADAFCALDSTAVGETMRWIASLQATGNAWTGTLYAQYYDWHMLSNPTYDYQINQFDRRWIAGGKYEHSFKLSPALLLTTGAEARYDDIGNVGVEHTDAAVFVEPIARHAIRESSAAAYTEATWTLDRLRVTAGLRGDVYDFDVRAKLDGLAAGNETDSIASPKLGLAWSLNDQLELYANWGKGFHSNDARGVVNPATPIQGLSEGEGREVGARFERGEFRLTTTYWWLDLDSELKFVGDSNSVEPGAATERRGYELVGFWRPSPWLAIDGVWTGSHARYVDSPGADHVPGAVENAAELGVSAIRDRWEASVRVRYLGEYPLVEDNSLRAAAETTVNVRGAWKPGPLTLYVEVLNLLDDDGKEIVYYYESNVAGLDPPGVPVAGRMSRVGEPRTLRVGLRYEF